MPPPDRRIAALTLTLGLLCALIFAGLVAFYGRELRTDIRQRMIERAAAVLYPVAQQQIQSTDSLASLLPDAGRQGTLALALFDEAGVTVETVPANQPLTELPVDDFVQVQNGRPLTRFHPEFPLSQLQPGVPADLTSPVLEIVLPLFLQSGGGSHSLLGFVRYHLDARPLAAELAALDENVARQTRTTLLLGLGLIGLIVLAAHVILRRAQRTIAERTARLQQANFELTLAAKASALGQITSHLLHDLQGSVAGLRAVVAGQGEASGGTEWKSAADYTTRMQTMIAEAVTLLGDSVTPATNYEITGEELASLLRRRNQETADTRGVNLLVHSALSRTIDGHRGGLLCLIASNLAQNALAACPPGRTVRIDLADTASAARITVADEGPGIAPEIQAHLFEPGRSGRPGGSGLGLAISRLLARQIGAELDLVSTGPQGTVFGITLPLDQIA